MAYVYKRGKTWYIKSRDHTGKQVMTKGYSDKAETQRLATSMEDMKTRIKRGDIDPQAEVRKVERARPVADHITDYETTLKARGSSVNHTRYTVSDIRAFFSFTGLDNANAVQRQHVDRWVLQLKADEDSMNTINRRVCSLQSFLRQLKATGGVSEYTLNKYPKQRTKGTERRRRRALSAREVEKLLNNAPADRVNIYRFALLTGFRFSEVCSMTPGSFNFQRGVVTVKASDAKNKRRDQTIPLHPELLPIVQGLCEGRGREENIFAMMRREDAAKLLRQDCTASAVDTTHIDFHALRHTFITRLAESNVHPKVLQALARHSSIETTLNFYTHFKPDNEHRAIAALPA